MSLTWLAGTTAAIMAGITVPTLVLLYFLKLRRREVPVSSTLLWQKAVQDLQVNAPFQRIRRNILLLLQLLILAALLFALARPVSAWRGRIGKRYVLLVDRSASMMATDTSPSRLEEATGLALKFLDTMERPSWTATDVESDQAMVVAFADTAEVVVPFTADRQQLEAGIRGITAVPGRSNLAGAVTLANAFATPVDVEGLARSTVEPPKLILFSDGRIRDIANVVVGEGQLELVTVGTSGENVALVSLDATRSYEQPNQVTVFGQFANFGREPAAFDATLSIDGNVQAVKPVTVPAFTPAEGDTPARPGQAPLAFDLEIPESGVLELRKQSEDALEIDNAGWVVLPPPRQARLLLVTDGNPALELALGAMSLAGLEVVAPADIADLSAAQLQVRHPADITVLDRASAPTVPGMQYITFGQPPDLPGISVEGTEESGRVLEWQDRHPVLLNVELSEIYSAKYHRVALPADALVLAEAAEGPLIAVLHRGGARYLTVHFDVLDTNWPFRPSWIVFLVNAVRFLSTEELDATHRLRPGDALEARLPVGAEHVDLTLPDGRTEELKPDPNGRVYYAPLDQLGIYRIRSEGAEEEQLYAVNLLDEEESAIEPVRELQLASGAVPDLARAGAARWNRHYWPYLALAGMVVLLVEWYIYNRKVQL